MGRSSMLCHCSFGGVLPSARISGGMLPLVRISAGLWLVRRALPSPLQLITKTLNRLCFAHFNSLNKSQLLKRSFPKILENICFCKKQKRKIGGWKNWAIATQAYQLATEPNISCNVLTLPSKIQAWNYFPLRSTFWTVTYPVTTENRKDQLNNSSLYDCTYAPYFLF